MRTIVVCLDGTNQTKTQEHPTNIARIFDSLGGVPTNGDFGSLETITATAPPVLGKYIPGVGTQGDPALKVLGNLFGDGIAQPIVRGYTYLSRTYQPGDAIILTGFSRGATAARALAGFVTGKGLLDPARYAAPADKNEAYRRAIAAWYQYREPVPSRANPDRPGLIKGMLNALTQPQDLPELVPQDFVPPPLIKAVAVFDTVSSLGLPHLDANGDAVFDFSICDTTLSDKVELGFHALAADEMRDLFSPTFWANRENVFQQIFPGAHSDVGGGYPNRGLSDAALKWMFENLTTAGLTCDASVLNPPLAPDALGIAQDDGATFPFKDTPRRARAFPDCATLSTTLADRLGKLTEMLPNSAPMPYRPAGVRADGSPL